VHFMQLSANLTAFPGFSHEMPLCLTVLRRNLACLKTKPAF
jgi:hypothetical protein